MKCLKRRIIFDFINKELSAEVMNCITIHLKSCEQCSEMYHQAVQQIQLVKESMDILTPENIPEPLFCLSQDTEKTSRRSLIEIIQEKLNFPIGVGWKKAVVCALLIFLIASIFTLRTDHGSNEMKMQQYLMAAENYYEDDPKAGWTEKGLVIAIFNKEKNTLELVETSMDDSETSSVKYEVNE